MWMELGVYWLIELGGGYRAADMNIIFRI